MKYLMEEIRMRPDIKLLIYYDDLLTNLLQYA